MEDTIEKKLTKLSDKMEDNYDNYENCGIDDLKLLMEMMNDGTKLMKNTEIQANKYYSDEMRDFHLLFEYVMNYQPTNYSDKEKFNKIVEKIIKNIENEYTESKDAYDKQMKMLTVPENSKMYPVIKIQKETFEQFAKNGLENDKEMFECIQKVKEIMKQDYSNTEYFKRIIFEFTQKKDKFEKQFKEIAEVNEIHNKSIKEMPELDERIADMFNGNTTKKMDSDREKIANFLSDFEGIEKLSSNLKKSLSKIDNKEIEEKIIQIVGKISLLSIERLKDGLNDLNKEIEEILKQLEEKGIDSSIIKEIEINIKQMICSAKKMSRINDLKN